MTKDDGRESGHVDTYSVYFLWFFIIKKSSFIIEGGISYTFAIDPVFKINKEFYGYSTLCLYKQNYIYVRKITPRNIIVFLLLL